MKVKSFIPGILKQLKANKPCKGRSLKEIDAELRPISIELDKARKK